MRPVNQELAKPLRSDEREIERASDQPRQRANGEPAPDQRQQPLAVLFYVIARGDGWTSRHSKLYAVFLSRDWPVNASATARVA